MENKNPETTSDEPKAIITPTVPTGSASPMDAETHQSAGSTKSTMPSPTRSDDTKPDNRASSVPKTGGEPVSAPPTTPRTGEVAPVTTPAKL